LYKALRNEQIKADHLGPISTHMTSLDESEPPSSTTKSKNFFGAENSPLLSDISEELEDEFKKNFGDEISKEIKLG